MANAVYNNAKKLIGDGTIDWDDGAATFRLLLVNTSYTVNIDTHIYVADITPLTNELSGTGYSRKDLTTRTVVVDNANDRADYKADNVTWVGINAGTAAGAIVYKFVSADADSPLICYIDFADTVTNGGDFTLKFNGDPTNGAIFRIS